MLSSSFSNSSTVPIRRVRDRTVANHSTTVTPYDFGRLYPQSWQLCWQPRSLDWQGADREPDRGVRACRRQAVPGARHPRPGGGCDDAAAKGSTGDANAWTHPILGNGDVRMSIASSSRPRGAGVVSSQLI